MDLELPALTRRRALLAAGYSDRELRRLRRSGKLTTVRRGGSYVTPTGRGAGEAGRHTLVISAVLPELAAGSVISHSSAVCCTARIKYGRLLRPAQEPGDVVFDEKLREDRLRDAGLSGCAG